MTVDDAVVAQLREKMAEAARVLAFSDDMIAARVALIDALNIVTDLIEPTECNLQPMIALIEGLAFLNRGDVLDLLKKAPERKGGRPQTTLQRSALQACAVAAVEELKCLKVSKPQARKMVAKILADEGFKADGGGPITRRTIQTWQEYQTQHWDSYASKIARNFPHVSKELGQEEGAYQVLTVLKTIARGLPKKR